MYIIDPRIKAPRGNPPTGELPLDADGNPVKVSNYVPAERTIDELDKVERMSTGINFEKYDKIKVEVSHGDRPYTPIE